MMNTKSKVILALLSVGVILFCLVQFVLVPQYEKRQELLHTQQNDSLTHSIETVLDYRSDYIGDNSNTANLFYHLPLNCVSMKFEINPQEYSLTVSYLDTVGNIGENKVQRDLIYNSVAAMALINNLRQITYQFSGSTFIFTRSELEASFGSDLSALLESSVWRENVQNKLGDSSFVAGFYR